MRYIVEKQFGNIKNFKALNNVRNKEISHIQIDYRIACAMCNFNHKPSCPDGQNAEQIAISIRKLAKKKLNRLEDLLTKRLDTKDLIEVNIQDIADFPRLSVEDISTNITMGSFKLRQSKSYISDLMKNGKHI